MINLTRANPPLNYSDLVTESLRKQLYKAVCANADQVTDTGAWCLVEGNDNNTSYGYPMAYNHATPDEGVARTISSLLKPGQQLLDLGCGIGQYGQFFKENNATFAWSGYDGAVNVQEYTHGFVKWADLTIPGFSADGHPDWVMALEIGEHVPASFEQIIINNIDANNRCGAVVSWAIPGQGGHHHVNLKSNEWVIDQFTRRGYVYDDETSSRGRELARYGWFKNTFMVFRRSSTGRTC